VFERCGWRCGICGDGIDAQLVYPDPWCATVDHITALSLGGADDDGNLQAAHFTCNIRKRQPIHGRWSHAGTTEGADRAAPAQGTFTGA